MSFSVVAQKERLLADLEDLELAHEAGRAEALRAMEVLEAAKNRAFVRLVKTGELFALLTWKQEEAINSRCTAGTPPLEAIRRLAGTGAVRVVPGAALLSGPEQSGPLRPAQVLKRMNALRKNIVRFGLVRDRARELSGALVQSLKAFEFQYRSVCRALFPLGFFSRLWRSLRKLLSRSYFSWRDLPPLQNLGMAAGFVLKMAEAPLF